MSSPLSDSSMSPHSLLEDLAVASPESLSSSRGSTPCSAFPSTPTSITAVPSTAESEKKPVKKRKSWGQELPTPTTNLAPRKRAKTAEEKEQRRVERVLRNRAAAQKSREVKKQQLEKIEKERDELKEQNERLVASNKQLQEMLDHIQGIQETTTLREASCGQSVKDEPAYDFDGAFTLNPNNLLSQDMKNESSLCMTHQPAALMCDLLCLQGTSSTTFSLILLISLVWSYILEWTFRLAQMPTLVWPLPQNRAQYYPLILFLTNLLTANVRLLQHSMSKRCNLALAHLRIATGFSLQPATALNAAMCQSFQKINFERSDQEKELSRVLGTSANLGHFSGVGKGQRLVNHVVTTWVR